jgi:hypothetical protein
LRIYLFDIFFHLRNYLKKILLFLQGFTLQGMSFSLAQRKELKETSTLTKAFPYMGRMQLIPRTGSLHQSFGMARKACAPKGASHVLFLWLRQQRLIIYTIELTPRGSCAARGRGAPFERGGGSEAGGASLPLYLRS